MFKSFEAEAFIIPTGSMAPSLQGQHMDLACAQCGYRYLTGASSETHGQNVIATNCPICRYHTVMDVRVDAEHRSNSGDRILVNKFIYDFSEPKRFDVIVFKNPQNGKQNFIKRLIGLPGENILIENGDIYVMTPNGDRWDREICVKSPEKLRQVLIEVDDTKYIGHELETAGWPSRWNQWTQKPSWSIDASGGNNEWHVDAQSDTEWLRYRHLHPVVSQWPTIKTGKLPTYMEVDSPVDLPPGRLITDTHAYNDYDLERIRHPGRNPTGFGYHWVGDIGLEAWCDIESDSGVLELDIVEGGVHFSCKIDVGSGEATLHSSDPTIGFFNDAGDKVATPTATGVVNGSGTAQLLFLNADDQLFLWVDDSLVSFDASRYKRDSMPVPKYSPEDPADAEPVGIGAKDLALTVTRMKVVRDIYYSSVNSDNDERRPDLTENETGLSGPMIEQVFNDPLTWDGEEAKLIFRTKRNQQEPMFTLERGDDPDKHQFLPMGDNSTQSQDGRMWDDEHFVERDMLIGRAIFVYWPHTLNKPVQHFPNFKKMKFIR